MLTIGYLVCYNTCMAKKIVGQRKNGCPHFKLYHKRYEIAKEKFAKGEVSLRTIRDVENYYRERKKTKQLRKMSVRDMKFIEDLLDKMNEFKEQSKLLAAESKIVETWHIDEKALSKDEKCDLLLVAYDFFYGKRCMDMLEPTEKHKDFTELRESKAFINQTVSPIVTLRRPDSRRKEEKRVICLRKQ